MVFICHGSAEQSHNAVTGELVDGSFMPVNFFQQDFRSGILYISWLPSGPNGSKQMAEAQSKIPLTSAYILYKLCFTQFIATSACVFLKKRKSPLQNPRYLQAKLHFRTRFSDLPEMTGHRLS